MPSANTVKRDSAPPREQVEHGENAALLSLENCRELVRINARHRNVRAKPIDNQREHKKPQATFQVA